MRLRLALIVASLGLSAGARLGGTQAPILSQRPGVQPQWAVSMERLTAPPRLAADTAISHRRATVIGATVGAVVGGLGTAGFILNALAPHCVTAISANASGPTVHSTHCTHRSRIVVLETVTIAAGATVGGFAVAWVARRIAGRRDHRHRDPLPNDAEAVKGSIDCAHFVSTFI